MGWAERISDRNRDIKTINERLKKVYGCTLDGKPRFRLVHCSELTEKRKGIFSDWYGHILIRTVEEIREVYKYQEYRDCYALETVIYAKLPELISEDGSAAHYEPIWVFHDRQDKPVRPVWDAVELIVKCLLFGAKKTLAERQSEEDVKKRKRILEIMEYLDNRAPYLATRLKERRAVVVPDLSGTKG